MGNPHNNPENRISNSLNHASDNPWKPGAAKSRASPQKPPPKGGFCV